MDPTTMPVPVSAWNKLETYGPLAIILLAVLGYGIPWLLNFFSTREKERQQAYVENVTKLMENFAKSQETERALYREQQDKDRNTAKDNMKLLADTFREDSKDQRSFDRERHVILYDLIIAQGKRTEAMFLRLHPSLADIDLPPLPPLPTKSLG